MLKACLNGQRGRAAHPAVPVTPTELAADAARCAALGVAAVHIHPRDAAGVESLRPAVIADALTAIRAARPGLPVGVSTGAWIEPDPAARVAAVRSWPVLPDFASVNAHEPGAEAVAAALHERGVLVEVGLWTVDAGVPPRSTGMPGGSPPEDAVAPPVLLHAEGPATWAVLAEAVSRGLHTRIGLEDTLLLPDGVPAPGNAALVTAALAAGAG
ncbi:3-keto-5-aminohexanoate cleavage protein [Micromonospora sp. NPDC005237]|uniref:3-keto-5-aminohexanoate cleavage protein n=1 Tax=Micromonospora sp. NPDC005237 TaxID=3155113 RepID=UPI0033AB7E8B